MQKQKKILTGLIAAVVVLLIVFMALFFLRQNNKKTVVTHSAFTKVGHKKDAVADLSIRQAAGLAIVYAHLKYTDNQNWNEIYQDANNGDLEIDRYQQYQFGNYSVKPNDSQALYVVNKEAALIFTNPRTPGQGRVLISDEQQRLGEADTHTIYKYVKSHGMLNTAKKISHKMNLETQAAVQPQSQSKTSQSQSKQSSSLTTASNKQDPNLQPVAISSKLQGTWVAAGLFATKLGEKVQIGSNSIDNQTIYKLNKMPSSTKALKEFGQKYHGKLFAIQNKDDVISVIPAQNLETDSQGYELTTLDGVQCLSASSTGPSGLYFRSLTQAQHFTQKYHNKMDQLTKKIMN